MRDDQKERLEKIQETSIDHAIEAIESADKCDIATKDGRGDRAWLTKGANESMKLACSIQRLFEMKAAIKQGQQPPQSLETNAKTIIDKAEQQIEKRRQGMGQKYS